MTCVFEVFLCQKKALLWYTTHSPLLLVDLKLSGLMKSMMLEKELNYKWAGKCCYLVQDFERCLRTDLAVATIKKAGLELVDGYPRCSQDFNAIEIVWDLMKRRLENTLPTARKPR